MVLNSGPHKIKKTRRRKTKIKIFYSLWRIIFNVLGRLSGGVILNINIF